MKTRVNNIVVFLDRDGVINNIDYNSNNIINVDKFQFITNSPLALKNLNQKNIKTFIITNELGIEDGLYTEDDYIKINNYIIERLKDFGVKIDDSYYCTEKDSFNKKPEPGMIYTAIREHNLDSYKKYLIGDSLEDIVAGNVSGCITFLVKTGKGIQEYEKIKKINETPKYYVSDLNEAVNIILEREFDIKASTIIDSFNSDDII